MRVREKQTERDRRNCMFFNAQSSMTVISGRRERERDRQTDRTNERTNEFFINEGKGISTIYFFSSSPRAKKQTKNKTKKQSKTK